MTVLGISLNKTSLVVPFCMRAYTSEQNCLRPHKTIRGKFRSCGFGSNFCPVEVAQWPKASLQVMGPARYRCTTVRAPNQTDTAPYTCISVVAWNRIPARLGIWLWLAADLSLGTVVGTVLLGSHPLKVQRNNTLAHSRRETVSHRVAAKRQKKNRRKVQSDIWGRGSPLFEVPLFCATLPGIYAACRSLGEVPVHSIRMPPIIRTWHSALWFVFKINRHRTSRKKITRQYWTQWTGLNDYFMCDSMLACTKKFARWSPAHSGKYNSTHIALQSMLRYNCRIRI